MVIMHKKTGEIHLCIDFRALNAITIRDSFPLPQIEEALQDVKSAMCFTSIDLAQGYLQLAMDEADIHKTASRAGSSGLYEFTHMPFRLSNVGASFCCLMEMCLGDQQYLTLLFYLDDICIFSSSVDEMLNRIEMVLKLLQDFNLKIKPKKSFFLSIKGTLFGPYLIKRWDFSKSRKSSEGKGLASSIQCERGSFIFGTSVLLSPVYTTICEVG